MIKAFSVTFITAAIMLCSAHHACAMGKAEIVREPTYIERQALTHGSVYATAVASPLERFILVRKGNDVCAVRFTSFHRDYDAKQITLFHSGQENVYAEYDWYYQGDGSFDFRKDNVKSGHEKLHDGPSIGIGRMAFKAGLKYWIDCGPFKLDWAYPANLLFATYDGSFDREVELAPTKWSKIEEIDFKHPKLRWFRFEDHKGEESYIPMEELP